MGKPEGRNHLEDPSVDKRVILKWFLQKWDGGIDWIDLVQDRNRWGLVNAVMSFRVLHDVGNFLTS